MRNSNPAAQLVAELFQSPWILLSGVALTLIGSLTFYVVYQRYFSPLSGIPGPFLASITPLWRLYRVLQGDWHMDIVKLHEKYGMGINNPRVKTC
jgi:hypothetical protein